MIDTAVILAAGRGSRLKEVTAHRSKAMVPIAGKPIIERVMDELRVAGISKLIVVGAPHDTELETFCSASACIKFVAQPIPKGSADALKQAETSVPDRFVVCACDSIVPSADLIRLWKGHSLAAVATLGVQEVAPTVSLSSRSVLVMRGDRVEKIIEKPTPEQRTTNLSSLPLYVLSKNIFAELSELKPSTRGEYELPEAFQNVIAKGGVINGVTIPSRMDLTDQTDLLALNEYFLKRQSPAVLVSDSFVPSSAVLEGPVLVESEVSLGQGVHLGPCVYIEKGASVSDGVRLERVVVLRGAKVASSASGRVIVT